MLPVAASRRLTLSHWGRWFSFDWTRRTTRALFVIINNVIQLPFKMSAQQKEKPLLISSCQGVPLGGYLNSQTVILGVMLSVGFLFPPDLTLFFYLDTKTCHRKEVSKKGSWYQHTSWKEEKVHSSFGDPESSRAQESR